MPNRNHKQMLKTHIAVYQLFHNTEHVRFYDTKEQPIEEASRWPLEDWRVECFYVRVTRVAFARLFFNHPVAQTKRHRVWEHIHEEPKPKRPPATGSVADSVTFD